MQKHVIKVLEQISKHKKGNQIHNMAPVIAKLSRLDSPDLINSIYRGGSWLAYGLVFPQS